MANLVTMTTQGKVEYKARTILETLYSMRYIELYEPDLLYLHLRQGKMCGGRSGVVTIDHGLTTV